MRIQWARARNWEPGASIHRATTEAHNCARHLPFMAVSEAPAPLAQIKHARATKLVLPRTPQARHLPIQRQGA